MQITSVTLTDAATTPVARVFSRWKSVNDIITLLYRSATMPFIGANKLSIGRRDGAPSNGNATKLTFQLAMPTLAEVSPSTSTGITPQPVVAYEHFREDRSCASRHWYAAGTEGPACDDA